MQIFVIVPLRVFASMGSFGFDVEDFGEPKIDKQDIKDDKLKLGSRDEIDGTVEFSIDPNARIKGEKGKDTSFLESADFRSGKKN